MLIWKTAWDDRALRREVYEAYVTRASDQGPNAGRWDNGPVMEDILALRHELADLLGFANYAGRSLATKMARTTAEVMDFLQDLARRSKTQGERELEELCSFARDASTIIRDSRQPVDIRGQASHEADPDAS